MRFDAHVHLNFLNDIFMNYVVDNQMRLLSIVTEIPGFPTIEAQVSLIENIRRRYPDTVDFATTFSCSGWGGAGWLNKSLDTLKRSIDAGAVGVKIWKNIGMSLKDGEGRYVMVDHPSFEPIFQFLEDNNIVLLGHNGEPRNCWLPVEEMTVESDKIYFSSNPEYHMYRYPELPAYDSHLEARNRMLRKHPTLRFVGLHLASQERSVSAIARFLDEFPNARVDLAERICHLQYQAMNDWQGVYDFFISYQDRIIYGSDIIIAENQPNERTVSYIQEKYRLHDQFLRKRDWMTVPKVRGKFRGMGLPDDVTEKISRANALGTYRYHRSSKTSLIE
jgi:predicted TIM-barrel fold metal-dependent hydrolase